MVVNCSGVIHGKHIELEQETELPDGAVVTVRIEANGMPLEERQRRMRALCGQWRDESLDAVFSDIVGERSARGPREIKLNDPS